MPLSLRAAIVPTDPSAAKAPSVAEEETIAWYFLVAVLTLLVYDALTTMDKEAKYFWDLSVNRISVIYFLNRYIGLLGAISNLFSVCNDVFVSPGYGADTVSGKFAIWSRSLSYILMTRVLALYSKGKLMTMYLKSFLVLAAASRLAILVYITWIQDIAIYKLAIDVTICGERKDAAIGWAVADWLIPMAYGVVLLVLALYKAMLYQRFSAGFSGPRLVKVLIHDQIIYFLLVVACCVLNILQFKIHVTNNILAGILSTLGCPSLLCVVGSHMLFNLKEAGNRDLIENSTYSAESGGTIEYVHLQKL
ncbi:hypothetical protein A7U60_g922 [Sanghuangporus baumii]|uniref:DUF6533 domain-containing protein n=1 Tax=Sanghuangporus baumii TaxID=108892 RepID=A0A9Q5I534_SANBA|nr:hypothetical protein A7U60_g922 [Sanghuangporus baumii]